MSRSIVIWLTAVNMFLDVLGELFENPDVPETAEYVY